MVQAAKNIDLPVSKPVLSIDMIIDMQPKVFFYLIGVMCVYFYGREEWA